MATPWTELVAKQVPGAELRIVQGVAHFAQIEAADIVSKEINSLQAACLWLMPVLSRLAKGLFRAEPLSEQSFGQENRRPTLWSSVCI
jgi:hypothetical protein